MIKRFLLKFWFTITRKSPNDFEMVKYWKHGEAVAAKVTQSEEGHLIMIMEGEKYPFPSFPRGHLLIKGAGGEFPDFSKLKHEIKNQIFNESWYALERGEDRKEIIKRIKSKLFNEITEIADKLKYDMLPPSSMTPAVREIHRAWTKVAPESTYPIRDYLCLVLHEDDAYRFRVQYLVKWFDWTLKVFSPIYMFGKALAMLEHAEVIGDMRERMRLLRRILLLALEDPKIRELFIKFIKEVDWKKVALTKGDKYHLRAKYFRPDYPEISY